MLPWLRSSWPRSSGILRSCPMPGGRIRQCAHRHLRQFCPRRCIHSCKAALAIETHARGQGFRLIVFRGPQCQLAKRSPSPSGLQEPDISASAHICRTLAINRDCTSTTDTRFRTLLRRSLSLSTKHGTFHTGTAAETQQLQPCLLKTLAAHGLLRSYWKGH